MTELLFIVTLARIGTREPIQPQSVTTTAPPTHQDAYVDFLGIRIQKGKRHSVVFSRSDADRSFLTSNEGLWSAFEPELRTRLAQLDAPVTVGQRVRSVLLEALPGGGIEMEDVARRIAMSRRSLQRHLESEGLTYTDLLQSTRHALAEHYLVKTDLPVAEISFLLGFEEPNSFFRAFRGWCGQSPERFREASRALVKLTQ
jgi:AraC-like DNA-binding protein